jgi:hypothetical protein
MNAAIGEAVAVETHQPRTQPLRYIVNEVCIVVNSRSDDPGNARRYTEVLGLVNDAVRRLPRDFQNRKGGSFARDLSLDVLRPYFGGSAPLLAALELPREPDGGRSSATVSLPGRSDVNRTVSLLFYSLAVATDRGEQAVRELVNLLNLNRERLGLTLPGRAWQVLAATPNWLAAGAQEFTEGGPGARPEPAPPGTWDVHFSDPDLVTQLAAGTGKDVVVAVLDTCPDPKIVAEAIQKRGNRLLRDVAKTVSLGAPPSISQAYFQARLPQIVAGWQEAHPTTKADLALFPIPDHGLFVAGLVRDIVPDAEIHLIRVLSDFGVGDLLALSSVLSQLPQAFLQNRDGSLNGKRLVVNLSLMADIPPGISVRTPSKRGDVPPSNAFLRYWFPAAYKSNSGEALRRQLLTPQSKDIAEAIKDMHVGLQQAVEALTSLTATQPLPANDRRSRQVLVAAAGNDNRPRRRPPAPRLPARYDDVLGVAAVNRNFVASHYSNQGDELVIGNGVAILGGDAAPGLKQGDPNLIEMVPPPAAVDAVAGIFSAPTFPALRRPVPAIAAEDRQNRTGWAYWAGTSFATPIISAIAASLWSTAPTLRPAEVIQRVRAFDSGTTQLGCPTIKAQQVQ